jgi:hypothetical protein
MQLMEVLRLRLAIMLMIVLTFLCGCANKNTQLPGDIVQEVTEDTPLEDPYKSAPGVEDLAGFWHAAPDFSQGFGAWYRFFEGEGLYYYYDGAGMQYEGAWELKGTAFNELTLFEEYADNMQIENSAVHNYAIEYTPDGTVTGNPTLMIGNQKFWQMNKPDDLINGFPLYINHDYMLTVKDYQSRAGIRQGSDLGEHIIIYCDTDLYGFKISRITFDDDINFYFDEVVFSLDVLTADYYIEYVTATPETIPREAISFTDSDGIIQSYVLNYNGKDDSTCASKMKVWNVLESENEPADNVQPNIILPNWAWAISNGDYETHGDKLAALQHASPDNLAELTFAVSPEGLIPIRFEGEKKATEIDEFGYYPSYEACSGPYWSVCDGHLPSGDYYLLLPASNKDAILAFTPASLDKYKNSAAVPEDVAKMEALKKGRKVVYSELLATDADGGRVSVFEFANTNYGLLILAYIKGERVITKEFTTTNVSKNLDKWRVDAGEGIGTFVVNLLCKTEAGLVIGFCWYGPEGAGKYLLVENKGAFADFISESWYYYDGKYQCNSIETYGGDSSELWPDLDSVALVGTWEGIDSWGDLLYFTFRSDYTGETENNPITYSIDGNIIIYKKTFDTSWASTELVRAKIEGNKLIIDKEYTVWTLTKKE